MTAVRIIIAGGRDFNNYALLESEFQKFLNQYDNKDITIISGMARGADQLGIDIANAYSIPVIAMSADWGKYGKSAGYRRNAEMAEKATHLLAMWDTKSKGTAHMINLADAKGLTIKVVNY